MREAIYVTNSEDKQDGLYRQNNGARLYLDRICIEQIHEIRSLGRNHNLHVLPEVHTVCVHVMNTQRKGKVFMQKNLGLLDVNESNRKISVMICSIIQVLNLLIILLDDPNSCP